MKFFPVIIPEYALDHRGLFSNYVNWMYITIKPIRVTTNITINI